MPILDYRNPERERLIEKIRRAEAELKTAGPIHARDLRKHIGRLRREIKTYDRYRTAAAR